MQHLECSSTPVLYIGRTVLRLNTKPPRRREVRNRVSHVFNLTTKWRWEISLTPPSETPLPSRAGLVALKVGLYALEKRKISCPDRIHGEE